MSEAYTTNGVLNFLVEAKQDFRSLTQICNSEEGAVCDNQSSKTS